MKNKLYFSKCQMYPNCVFRKMITSKKGGILLYRLRRPRFHLGQIGAVCYLCALVPFAAAAYGRLPPLGGFVWDTRSSKNGICSGSRYYGRYPLPVLGICSRLENPLDHLQLNSVRSSSNVVSSFFACPWPPLNVCPELQLSQV